MKSPQSDFEHLKFVPEWKGNMVANCWNLRVGNDHLMGARHAHSQQGSGFGEVEIEIDVCHEVPLLKGRVVLKKLHVAVGRFLLFLIRPASEIESGLRDTEYRALMKLGSKAVQKAINESLGEIK